MIYYVAMWLFVAATLIGAVVACVRRKASSIPTSLLHLVIIPLITQDINAEDDSDEDEEYR